MDNLFNKYISTGNSEINNYNEVFSNEMFTSQLLYDMIKDPKYALSTEKINGLSPNQVQWAIFNMLMDVKKQGEKLDKVRKLANLSTSKLGISYFETIDKNNSLKELIYELSQAELAKERGEISEYNNWLNILGDFSHLDIVGSPTNLTIEGIQLLNSLKISSKIFPILFNYENNNLLNGGIIDKIFKIEEKEITSTSKNSLKEKYQIMSEFTNFINSGMKAFEGNTLLELQRLVKTTETNKSLGYILQDLRNKRHPIMQNDLLKDLEISIDPETNSSLIKHTAQDVGTLTNSNKIDAFLNLLIDNTILGEYNGEELKVYELAKDLISYSILSDNQNGATGYRQYIPSSYLESIGFNKNVRDFNNKLQEEHLEELHSRFIEQYLQHNPDKIKYKNVEKGKVQLAQGQTPPLYALERISKNVKKIWKYNQSTKSYQEIPILGSENNIGEAGINEYDFNQNVTKSVFSKEKVEVKEIKSNIAKAIKIPLYYKGVLMKTYGLEDYFYTNQTNKLFTSEDMLKGDVNSIKSLIDRLFNSSQLDDLNPGLKETWEIYKNYLNKDLKIKFEIPEEYKENKRFDGIYRHGENTIYINPEVFKNIYEDLKKRLNTDKIDMLDVFKEFRVLMMEEVLHSIQVDHLKAGWDTPQGKSIREKYQKALTLGITNPYLQNTGNEFVDVVEFIAGIYASPELREDLEKADKGFIDRFLYSLKRLLQELIPGKGFETIHHNMIEMVKQNFGKVNFLESPVETQQKQTENKQLTPAEKLNEIRKNDVKSQTIVNQTVEKSKVKSILDNTRIGNDIQSIMKNITDISSLSPEKLLSLLQEKGIVKKEC